MTESLDSVARLIGTFRIKKNYSSDNRLEKVIKHPTRPNNRMIPRKALTKRIIMFNH